MDWNSILTLVISLKWESHPTWVRGLKLLALPKRNKRLVSHPTWVRGLKHNVAYALKVLSCRTLRGCVDWNVYGCKFSLHIASRTLRGCVDWNFKNLFELLIRNLVAPYVGAWIETHIKNPLLCRKWGRTLRGCVDWNQSSSGASTPKRSRTLRGCVDWNLVLRTILKIYPVAPYVGAWIETWSYNQHYQEMKVAPYVGAWIET